MDAKEAAREARRRKILERGSDRLTLITTGYVNAPIQKAEEEIGRGQGDGAGDEIRDSTPTIAAPVQNPLINFSKDLETSKETLADQSTRAPASFPKHEEIQRSNDKITLQKPEETSPVQEIKREEPQISPNLTQYIQSDSIFTLNEISQMISNSEIIRLICSILFAFMAIKGFISSRPLLLLVLADISIILGFLIAGKDDNNDKKKKKKKKREKEKVNKYDVPADTFSLSLDTGLLVWKFLNAIFMDSSVYAVIIICALAI